MAEYAASIEIRATPDEVFDYLVTEAGLTAWMGEHATLDPRVGGEFSVNIAGSPIRGEYLEVDRPHRVVVSWGLAGSEEFASGTSRVIFTLSPTATGTWVDLLHADLPELRVAGHADGWEHFLPRLAASAQGETPAPDGWIPLPLRADVRESATELLRELGAELPAVTDGRMFNGVGLATGGRFFAFVSSMGRLVVKLPSARGRELVGAGEAMPVTMGKRTMREWVSLPPGDVAFWRATLGEALRFVGSSA